MGKDAEVILIGKGLNLLWLKLVATSDGVSGVLSHNVEVDCAEGTAMFDTSGGRDGLH